MDIDGLQEVIHRVDHWERNVEHGSWQQELADTLRNSIEKNYASEGRPAWPVRTYSYPWPILWKTGKKRDTEIMSAFASNWQHLGGASYQLDVYSAYYGPYHQFGTSRLPVRKSLLLQAEEVAKMHLSLLRSFT